eukprot:821575-Prymnesium_polylepis.1
MSILPKEERRNSETHKASTRNGVPHVWFPRVSPEARRFVSARVGPSSVRAHRSRRPRKVVLTHPGFESSEHGTGNKGATHMLPSAHAQQSHHNASASLHENVMSYHQLLCL